MFEKNKTIKGSHSDTWTVFDDFEAVKELGYEEKYSLFLSSEALSTKLVALKSLYGEFFTTFLRYFWEFERPLPSLTWKNYLLATDDTEPNYGISARQWRFLSLRPFLPSDQKELSSERRKYQRETTHDSAPAFVLATTLLTTFKWWTARKEVASNESQPHLGAVGHYVPRLFLCLRQHQLPGLCVFRLPSESSEGLPPDSTWLALRLRTANNLPLISSDIRFPGMALFHVIALNFDDLMPTLSISAGSFPSPNAARILAVLSVK